MKSLFLTVALVLLGCATPDTYESDTFTELEERLNSYLGKRTFAEAVVNYGPTSGREQLSEDTFTVSWNLGGSQGGGWAATMICTFKNNILTHYRLTPTKGFERSGRIISGSIHD